MYLLEEASRRLTISMPKTLRHPQGRAHYLRYTALAPIEASWVRTSGESQPFSGSRFCPHSMDGVRNWFAHLQLLISKCPLFSVEQALNLGCITTNLAKIAATWHASVSMVVTSESLISLRSATGPPETLWPVVVHLLLVGVKFLLEFIFQFGGFGS
jgi:hypothetical protein